MSALTRISEVWRFREVVKNFVSQNLKVKYRRSALGFFWSLLNPLLQMAVLSTVFSLLLRGVENFSLYLLSGLLAWTFFASSLDACSVSIVSAELMIKRQYFPKLVFPLSLVLQNLVTFVLSFVVLLLILGWFIGFKVSPALLVLPLSLACLVGVVIGLGAVLAVLTVYFRDMQHLISVVLSVWFYLTPIIYPLEGEKSEGAFIPHEYRWYFKLNPMYSVMAMFQRPIYYHMWPTPSEMAVASATAIVALAIGLLIFWKSEDSLIFAL